MPKICFNMIVVFYKIIIIFMTVFLILILLISQIQSIDKICTKQQFQHLDLNQDNTICPLNSHCLDNNHCACDPGYIGGCNQTAHQMQDGTSISATVTDGQYTYFSITQETDIYVVLIFTLCHTQSNPNLQEIDVWEDKGMTDTFDKSNSLPGSKDWAINSGCFKLSTPLMVFGDQKNGLSQLFILGIKLKNPGSLNLNLALQINIYNFWDLFQKFVFILGGIFVFMIILTIALFIFKWRRGRRIGRTSEQKDITHFQNFMPKYKLNKDNRYRIHEQTCAVCLLELKDDQWLRKTICNHIFHQQCLDQWCKSNLNCPICRCSFELKDFQHQILRIQNVPSVQMRNPLIQ